MAQAARLTQLARDIMGGWANGREANARHALEQHPEIAQRKSLAVELAYEEFCRRRAAGENVERKGFCAQFPQFQASLLRRLEVDEFFEGQGSFTLGDGCLVRWPELGEEVLCYRLVEKLGEGAIGRVYRAEDLSLSQRPVVIKLSAVGLREAETLSKLEHPHVVPVYAADIDPAWGLTCLCMPYLGRMTLQDWLDELLRCDALPDRMTPLFDNLVGSGILPASGEPDEGLHRSELVEGTLRWSLQLAQALAHTHARQIYHLDLKPSNVLVTHRLSVMLLDFNLSVAGEMAASTLGGTLPYMSPEQLESLFLPESSARPKIDGRADLFSLGVLLYQLLTRRLPFELSDHGGDPLAAAIELRELQARPRVPLREINPSIDEDVGALIDQCLAEDRSARPVSAAAFGDAVQAILDQWGTAARWVRKHRRWFLSGAAASVVGLAMGGAALAAREPEQRRVRREAWEHFQGGENDAALERFNRLIALDDNDHDAWFGRGLTRLRLRDGTNVIDDFFQASRLQADGRYHAYAGYCLAHAPNWPAALKLLQQAVDAGFSTAEVWNDIGFCAERTSSWSIADAAFRRASLIDPHLAAPWHNQIRMRLRNIQSLAPLSPEQAAKLIEQAVTLDPRSADLAYDSICLLLKSFPEQASADRILELCTAAIANGCTFDRLSRIPFLGPLARDPRFLRLKDASAGAYHPTVLLLDPQGDEQITWQVAKLHQLVPAGSSRS